MIKIGKATYNRLGANMVVVTIRGVEILFSYNTPVAGFDGKQHFRTETKFSKTTSKHINQYLRNAVGSEQVKAVPQSYIEQLAA